MQDNFLSEHKQEFRCSNAEDRLNQNIWDFNVTEGRTTDDREE